jgi:hypothetical protein
MNYPTLQPEQANFCAVCRKQLNKFEKKEYMAVNMPPLCTEHLADLLTKRNQCLHLFKKLNLS